MIPAGNFDDDQVASAYAYVMLIMANPSLADEAPALQGANLVPATIRARVSFQNACMRCGEVSRVAYILKTPSGPRWLDLCAMDAHYVQLAANTDLSMWTREH
jgi:hypothetical protein